MDHSPVIKIHSPQESLELCSFCVMKNHLVVNVQKIAACVLIICYSLWMAKGSALHRRISTMCIKSIWPD